MRSITSSVLVALAAGLLSACTGPNGGEGDRPGRIVLISMDTTRADRVSVCGSADTTPVLAQIAARGVVFRRFYAASTYTIPAHMSIFTGLDPAEHGLYRAGVRLGPQVRTLAEALHEGGYRTQAFHEGGYVGARFGFDRGFADYRERNRMQVVTGALPEILDWMRAAREEPYFLFLHTYAAHYPYGGFDRYRREHPGRRLPSDARIAELRARYAHRQRFFGLAPFDIGPEIRTLCTVYNQLAEVRAGQLGCGDQFLSPRFLDTPNAEADLAAIRESYDARIRIIDGALAQIRDVLRDLGQWDDTLLVVTSDHGEAFLEHGHSKHDYVPFDEVLKVPLVISYPRRLRAGSVRVVEELTWQLDLMPTILGLAGLPRPELRRGMDLTPVLLGRESVPADRAVFPAVLHVAHRGQRPLRRVALQGGDKYIEGHEEFGDAEGLLFDLGEDPGETRNLRAARPARFAELTARAREWASGLEPDSAVRTGFPAKIPEEEREKLRELGYLD